MINNLRVFVCKCFTCRNWWDLTDDVAGVLVGTGGGTEVSLLTLDVWLHVHVILESVILHQSLQTFIETQVQINIWFDLDGGPVLCQVFWLITWKVNSEVISQWRHFKLLLLHLDDGHRDPHDRRPAQPVVPRVAGRVGGERPM